MPQLNDASDALLQSERPGSYTASRFWTRIADFALRDNVLEVALGLITASAFTSVVNSFVSDIILPPLSLLPFLNKQLDEKFAILRNGDNYKKGGYNTLKQAIDDGAIVLAYGSFLDTLVRFMGVALSLYIIAEAYGYLSRDNIVRETVKCKYCRKRISVKARSSESQQNRSNSTRSDTFSRSDKN